MRLPNRSYEGAASSLLVLPSKPLAARNELIELCALMALWSVSCSWPYARPLGNRAMRSPNNFACPSISLHTCRVSRSLMRLYSYSSSESELVLQRGGDVTGLMVSVTSLWSHLSLDPMALLARSVIRAASKVARKSAIVSKGLTFVWGRFKNLCVGGFGSLVGANNPGDSKT